MNTLAKKIGSSVASVALVSGGMLAVATQAEAVGGNCPASLQEQEVTGYNNFRARASCTRLQGDSKARAKLIRDGGPDYHSQYFTRLNTYYYTNWYTCYAGCRASSEIDPV